MGNNHPVDKSHGSWSEAIPASAGTCLEPCGPRPRIAVRGKLRPGSLLPMALGAEPSQTRRSDLEPCGSPRKR